MKRFFSSLLIASCLVFSAAATASSASEFTQRGEAFNLIAERSFDGPSFTSGFMDQFNFSFISTTATQATFDFGFSDITSAKYFLSASNSIPASFGLQALSLQGNTGAYTAESAVHSLTPNTHYSLFVSGVGSGDGYTVTVTPLTPVPEPGEWAMMLSGLALLGRIARRRESHTIRPVL
jgi:MYXO-CTERM domain-containing protein